MSEFVEMRIDSKSIEKIDNLMSKYDIYTYPDFFNFIFKIFVTVENMNIFDIKIDKETNEIILVTKMEVGGYKV